MLVAIDGRRHPWGPKNCEACLFRLRSQPDNWNPWTESCFPWGRVHFCDPLLDRCHALVLVDSYTKWPKLIQTPKPITLHVIQVLRKCFDRERILQVLVAHSGWHFCATELKSWLDCIGSRHFRTAPRHTYSIGARENLLRVTQNALEFANHRGLDDLETFIDNLVLQHFNAVQACVDESPGMPFKSGRLWY